MSQSTDEAKIAAITAPFAAGNPTREDWEALFKVCWPEPPMRRMTGPYRPWLERVTSFMQFLNHSAYLDAADLLRPNGWVLDQIVWDERRGRVLCRLVNPGVGESMAHAPTEACARAIAAVRAREAG